MKKILVIIDGGSDLPLDVFGGKTPFEAAETPNLDFFTKNGKMGYMYPINERFVPGSDNALTSIFGNNFNLSKRGVYEAVGAGLSLKRGDLAARINFGTIENIKSKIVLDRRAGRTLTSKESKILAKTLNEKIKLPCEFELKSTIQHRGVLILRGGFSENISNIDSEYNRDNKKSLTFSFSKPFDDEDENGEYTSNILNDFVEQAFKILNNHPINLERIRKGLLPANMIFMRGFGVEIPKIKKYSNWMSINSMPLEIGFAEISKMKNFSFDYPELKSIDSYKNLYESLNKNIRFAVKMIKKRKNDFLGCYLQLKETDIPGHDNKPYEKKNMIEIIDKNFFGFLRKFVLKKKIKIVITCDHSTPCKLKAHSADPVPVLVYGDDRDDTVFFSENQAKIGSLGKIYGLEFMKKTGLNR